MSRLAPYSNHFFCLIPSPPPPPRASKYSAHLTYAFCGALFPQSLVLSFLHLMNTQLEMTLDFLSGVPDPTGKSALEYVFKIWCARQPEFFGVYDSKVR